MQGRRTDVSREGMYKRRIGIQKLGNRERFSGATRKGEENNVERIRVRGKDFDRRAVFKR